MSKVATRRALFGSAAAALQHAASARRGSRRDKRRIAFVPIALPCVSMVSSVRARLCTRSQPRPMEHAVASLALGNLRTAMLNTVEKKPPAVRRLDQFG